MSADLSPARGPARPGDIPFRLAAGPRRLGGALGLSVVSHTVGFVLVMLVASHVPGKRPTAAELEEYHLIWIPTVDPGGGSGVEVKQLIEAPRVKEVPEASPPIEEDKPEVQPEPNVPVLPIAAVEETPAESLGSLPTLSNESGGIDTGSGQGAGPGFGSGRGSGEGVYRPGPGIRIPIPVREVRPRYTVEAMRAKVEGSVLLEAVVLADGTVGEVHVIKSLDPSFGLDEEAVKAARQWRFTPGTRLGEPVAVRVSLTLTFTLR